MELNKKLPIVELYSAVQAEGSRAGYPTIVVRTTGCTHRCYFGEGGFCDSWYTSWNPEKGQYTMNDVIEIYKNNPHIKEMMLTGGSPTMHMSLINELNNFCISNNIILTIETEGSIPIEVDKKVNLISISPKFSNSIPKMGTFSPDGKEVTQQTIDQHNKFRKNIPSIARSIINNLDFHIKPVIDKDLLIFEEVEQFLHDLAAELVTNHLTESTQDDIFDLLKLKTWLMPAGATREALLESYGPVMNLARDKGYKFTGRPHVIAFDDKRYV